MRINSGNLADMLKRTFFIFLTVLFYFLQTPSILSQERLSVNPVSFSLVLKTGQMNTKFLEILNLESSYISVKTEYDTNWIAMYPSKFILLPSEKKKVMVVFSMKNGYPSKKQDEIIFRSKDGVEKSVLIKVVNNTYELTPDVKDTVSPSQLKERSNSVPNKAVLSDTVLDVNKQKKTNTSVKPAASPQKTKGIVNKPKLNVPRKPKQPITKQSITNARNLSQNYKDLVDSLQAQIKLLEDKLKRSENEISSLIVQIKRQDKRISDLLSNLTVDMINDLRDLFTLSNKYFKQEIQDESVEVTWSGDRFSILIDGQTGFLSGSIRLENTGKKILTKVATIANTKGKYEKVMTVRGHTDSYPIKKSYQKKIPSNWELSALRAATVVRTLEEEMGVAGEKLSLSAYSRFRPIADNKTEKGRRKNRRIEVVVAFRNQEAELFVTSKEK